MIFRAATPPGKAYWAAAICFLLQPACSLAAGIDTEHIYGFMIGSDVGEAGEREFQATTTVRSSKQAGNYQAGDHQLELEFVPFRNFRVEVATRFAAYDSPSVPGLTDRNLAGWQGAALDLRYKFLDRETAPFGLTLALENHG